jgi:hypothetical protein
MARARECETNDKTKITMTTQRLITQALIGGVLYFGISLILEKDMSSGTMQKEAIEAFVFALVYGAGLWAYYRFIKK